MNGFVDIYTLIFLVLAVVIFWKLRGVLGQRTGNERPPGTPFWRRGTPEPTKTIDAKTADPVGGDNVVSLPRRPDEAGTKVDAPVEAAADATPLSIGISAISAADRSFDPKQFIDGARTAYEMIVSAFARGDDKALKPLLGREVYDGFASAIADRQKRGETVEFNFVGIDKAELVDAGMKGTTAQVTVRFVSKLVSATRNKAGEVVDGDPVVVADVVDIWTFARPTGSRDPNWLLVATEAVD